MSCLIAAASIPLTSSVDIVTEGNSSGMNAVLRSHKLGGAPAEGPGRLGSRCNSSNIVKGREKGVGCSARQVSAPPARGFSSRADAHKGRGMGTVGEAGAPYPEAFNLQKKEKKKCGIIFFFSTNVQKFPPAFYLCNAGQSQDQVGRQAWCCPFIPQRYTTPNRSH